jgi:hypothetical protein
VETVTAPQRIRLRRTAGWRLRDISPDAIVVARRTKWGNPFILRSPAGLCREPAVHYPEHSWEYEGRISGDGAYHPYVFGDQVPDIPNIIRVETPGMRSQTMSYVPCHVRYMTPHEVVECYRAWINGGGWPIDWAPKNTVTAEDARRELAGHDLACWCPLSQPCHADLLLEIANTQQRAV